MCNFGNVQVLLIDDNPIWRSFAIKLLNEAGLTGIEVAYDGVQGVFKAQALQPDVILMDVRLPHMNGVEAAAKIRDAAPQSKIIFVTDIADGQVVHAAMNAGGLAYVLKPWADRQLIRAIRRVLQGE